jgi:hypothetical protein
MLESFDELDVILRITFEARPLGIRSLARG